VTRDPKFLATLATALRATKPERAPRAQAPKRAPEPSDATPASAEKPQKYKLARVSFRDEDWQTLFDTLTADADPKARVLQLQMLTGSRVGDVLRIERVQLQEALELGVLAMRRKGGRVTNVSLDGAHAQWQALLDAWPTHAESVAQWVSPGSQLGAASGGGAYQAVNRYLKALGARLGVRGRVHLHRIRRTVAVHALVESGGNLQPVQQLLGHSTDDSTKHYVDEFNSRATAGLTKKLLQKLNAPKAGASE